MLVAVFILVNLKRRNEQWLELHLTLMGQALNFTEADSAALGRRCCIFLRSEIGHPHLSTSHTDQPISYNTTNGPSTVSSMGRRIIPSDSQ